MGKLDIRLRGLRAQLVEVPTSIANHEEHALGVPINFCGDDAPQFFDVVDDIKICLIMTMLDLDHEH